MARTIPHVICVSTKASQLGKSSTPPSKHSAAARAGGIRNLYAQHITRRSFFSLRSRCSCRVFPRRMTFEWSSADHGMPSATAESAPVRLGRARYIGLYGLSA